jgi:glycerol dehydrogenase
MMKVFTAPARYVQGRDALSRIGEELESLGIEGKALVIISKHAEKATGQRWADSLRRAQIKWEVERFAGECSEKEVQRLVQSAERGKVDFVIAIGGGKVIDTGRALADKLGTQIVICPTIISTNTPCMAISVMYSEREEVAELRMFKRNPSLVLIDTEVIAKSPKRYFIAGMGDAIATYYEARVCKDSYVQNPRGGLATEAGFAIAKLCRDILLRDGAAALMSVEEQTVTPALERVIEACTLLSGMGTELCGAAAAHSIHNGLTMVSQTHSYYHGEKVAFALLAQLVMEGRPAREIKEVFEFFREVGLPITLDQIGISKTTPEFLLKVAERATRREESIHNEPFQVSSEMVIDALRAADQMGRKYQESSTLSFDAWSRAA